MYKSDIDNDAKGYLQANPGWPIYNPSWAVIMPSLDELFNTSITYYKGACVLHMLRYVLGDSTFFSAIHSYATDNTFRFGTSVTDDFVQKINSATGQDLTWFFDQWVKNANHPLYYNEYSLNPADSSATVKVTQTQRGVSWKMPIELKFTLSNGKDTTVRMFNSTKNQIFTVKLKAVPQSMVFDPNNNIALKIASTVQVTSVQKKNEMPRGFVLEQNYPNPFNPTTVISYQLPVNSYVTLKIFDLLGREVSTLVNEKKDAGRFSVQWDASARASGVYFYRLTAAGHIQTARMNLVK
jgi:aminopeptidase N